MTALVSRNDAENVEKMNKMFTCDEWSVEKEVAEAKLAREDVSK